MRASPFYVFCMNKIFLGVEIRGDGMGCGVKKIDWVC